MKKVVVKYPHSSRTICIPTEKKYLKCSVIKRFNEGGVWERRLTKMIYKDTVPRTIAIDIGANVGAHSISMLDKVTEHGYLIAFEPQQKLAECLNNTLSYIHKNYTVSSDLVSNTNSSSIFWSDGTGRSKIPLKTSKFFPGWTENKKNTTTLDTFLNKLQLGECTPRVSIIKIDVEGHEFQVLEGAKETIKTHKPIIYIEVWKKVSSRVKLLNWCYNNKYSITPVSSTDFKLFPN